MLIPIKQSTFNNGISRVPWTDDEIRSMNIVENLQHEVIGKFSYGWPNLVELRKIPPAQCNIKGEC